MSTSTVWRDEATVLSLKPRSVPTLASPPDPDPRSPLARRLRAFAVLVGLLAGLVVTVEGSAAANRTQPGYLPPYPTLRVEAESWPSATHHALHRARMTVVAHRGASQDAPENTLDAVRLAADNGADLVEVDVHQTRDGVLVVMHDSTVKRTTNAKKVFPKRRSWRVKDFTYREIRRLDAGGGFEGKYPRVRVPTLAEVFDVLWGTNTGLLLEVKRPDRYPGIERRIARLVYTRLAWLRQRRLVIASLDWGFLRTYKHRNPAATVAVIGTPACRDLPKVARYADMVNPEIGTVDARYLRRVHELGMTSFGWTVDEVTDMRKLLSIGADGLVTNRPDIVASGLYTPQGTVA